jgi:hypothetical protein
VTGSIKNIFQKGLKKMATEKMFNVTLNDVFRTTPLGSTDTAIGNVFYGINHRMMPGAVPTNKDSFGLTFFTRPQLNMSTANIRSDRRFIPLLNTNESSIQRIIRCYLDPRLNCGGSPDNNPIESPMVDPQCAFIPLLTNHLLSCSGWPDVSIDTYVSKPGAYKEVYSQVDSIFDIFSAYDVTASFRNMIADPITSLFYNWTLYQSLVFQGMLVPYPDFIMRNELDYNTRIYRLVLDSKKRYVQKIGCCGAAFPISVPMGAAFNFEHDKPLNDSNSEIQINFKCIGANYQDSIIIGEFNKVVEIFNSSMRKDTRSSVMQQIAYGDLNYFNNRGYPRIDPVTYELQWWISKDYFKKVVDSIDSISKTFS